MAPSNGHGTPLDVRDKVQGVKNREEPEKEKWEQCEQGEINWR